jgi:hypothetical protein
MYSMSILSEHVVEEALIVSLDHLILDSGQACPLFVLHLQVNSTSRP